MTDTDIYLRFLIQLARSRLKSLPYKINFALTERCNSRCKTCLIWQKQPPREGYGAEMSTDEIRSVFKNLPPSVTWLSLTGGEPFMRNDLDEIISSARQEIRNLTLLTIATNGRCRQEILRTVFRFKNSRDHFIFITFSLDGPKHLHDSIRGTPEGYDITWETYKEADKLLKNNPRFRVCLETTISKFNSDSLSHFLSGLADDGYSPFISLAHNSLTYGNDSVPVCAKLSPELSRTLALISRKLPLLKPDGFLKRAYIAKISSHINRTTLRCYCSAVKSSLTIRPDGTVHPCFIWDHPLLRLREEEHDLTKALSKLDRKAVMRGIGEGKCPGCWTPCEAFQTIIDNSLNIRFWLNV